MWYTCAVIVDELWRRGMHRVLGSGYAPHIVRATFRPVVCPAPPSGLTVYRDDLMRKLAPKAGRQPTLR